MDPATVLALLNIALPLAKDVFVMFRHKDGGVSVVALLDATDAQAEANIKQITEAMAAKRPA